MIIENIIGFIIIGLSLFIISLYQPIILNLYKNIIESFISR